jgi:hypothetical protein
MKPTLNEQLIRMQKLAGIITENQITEATGVKIVDDTIEKLKNLKSTDPSNAQKELKAVLTYISNYGTRNEGSAAETVYNKVKTILTALEGGKDMKAAIDMTIANLLNFEDDINEGSNTNLLDFSSWKRIMGDDNIYAMIPPSKKAEEGLDIWVYPAKNKVMIASNDDIMIQTIADKYNSEVYQEMAPSIYQVNLKLADLASLFPGQDFFLDDMNEGDTDYDRAKSAKRLGKKGEENIYGAGVKKGEEIEKEKMTKSKLKSKIKEMILAELNEDSTEDVDEPGALNNMYDPLAESKDDPQTAEDYYELFKEEDLIDDRREYDIEDFTLGGMDYQTAFELERILQPLDINDVDLGSITVEGNIYDDGYISSAKFKDGVDLIADQRIDLEDLLGKDKIAKLTNLNEAKKDEEVEDVTVDDTEVVDASASDMMAGESAEVSGIQANLQAAYAEAKALGDEKLITQIANTITYFTKAHILDTAPVNEAITNDDAIYDILSNMDNEDIINDMFTAIQQNPSMKLEDFLNQYDGGNDLGDDNDDNYDDSMDVYDDSYPDMAEAKKAKNKLDQINENMFPMLKRILR